jgi:hypothetical protein
LDFDPMVILRATSILGGQQEDKGMICSITPAVAVNNQSELWLSCISWIYMLLMILLCITWHVINESNCCL